MRNLLLALAIELEMQRGHTAFRGWFQLYERDAVLANRIQWLPAADTDDLVLAVVLNFPPRTVRTVDSKCADAGLAGRLVEAVKQAHRKQGTNPAIRNQHG